MRALAGEALLQAWELGAPQGYLDRAVTMLRAACPELQPDGIAEIGIPRLNLLLLQARKISFGSTLFGFVTCQHCELQLEFSLPIAPLLEQMELLSARDRTEWTDNTARYSLRVVSARDLLLAQAPGSHLQARQLLIERCLSVDGSTDPMQVLSGDGRSGLAVTQKFNELHACAEVTIQVLCPACQQTAPMDLDMPRFLWKEVRHAAMRLLREVHELASAYGWDEQAILTMTPQRRSAYLEMLHA